MPRRLVDLLIDHARVGAGELMVHEGGRLTYPSFAELAERTGEALARAGLRPGARVAFLGAPGPAFLVSQYATHLAGGVWLGLNPRYTMPELLHPLKDAAPALVVVDIGQDPGLLDAITQELENAPLVQPLARLQDLVDVPGPLAPPTTALSPEIALLVYTSGTTGVPKGAMLTHAGMLEAAQLYARRYAHPGMRTLLNLPINHVGASIDLVSPVVATGGALIVQKQFDPASVPILMREEKVTLLGQVPAMHLAIDAATQFSAGDFPALRHLVWSGAAMPRSWIEAHIGGPAELSTCYGLTECTGSCTFTRPEASVDELANTVGRPAQSGIVKVDAEQGSTGEIRIRGPLLMSGYLGQPDATAEAIDGDGWLHTGDIGFVDETGSLQLVGRSKEMYKSGGYNVYPREVETALEAHPAVSAAAVIGLPDPQWGEVGWAFVLARTTLAQAALESFARERLANYKLPKRYVISGDLPMLPIGKIDKQTLRTEAIGGSYD